MQIIIKSILKTRSPLHIAHPDSARMSDAGKKVYEPKAFPMTSVQTQTVPLKEAYKTTFKNDDGTEVTKEQNSQDYPVIAANNIAGRLRRHAAKQVLTALKNNGHKVSLHAYCVLTCGASSGIPDSDAMSFQEFKTSREHVYFGLFGGGPKMFERHLRVHSSLPITPTTTDLKGALAHPNAAEYAHSDRLKFTRMWGFRRLDDLAELTNIDAAEQSIEKFDEEFAKRQELILIDKGEKKRVSTRAYSAIEFVVPGVLFDLTMELDVMTDAQVGLYLETLDSFAATERLGGQVRNGFGVITFEDVSMARAGASAHSIFNNGRLDRTNPEVAVWLAAWQAEAQTLDAISIERLIAVKEKKDKQDKKASKTSASNAPETVEA